MRRSLSRLSRLRPAVPLAAALLGLAALAGCVATPPRPAPATTASLPAIPPEVLKPYRVRLSLDERSAELLGEITLLSGLDLLGLIERNPTVETLHLTSPGGSVGPALALAELVADRGLVTYVPLYCASACTVIFAAGRERLLAPGARLGYHSASGPLGDQAMAEALAASGLPASFIARIQATPHDGLWRPTRAELLAAGAATALRRLETPPKLAGAPLELVDWGLLGEPLLRAFAGAFPERMAPLRQAALADLAGEAEGAGSLEALLGPAVGRGVGEALPRSALPALQDFFRALRDYTELARDREPGACVDALGADAALGRADPEGVARQGEAMTRAMTEVLRSYAAAPATVDRRQARERLQAFTLNLWRGGVLSQADLAVMADPPQSPQRYCQIVVTILERALADAEAELILRGFAFALQTAGP